MLIWKDGVFAKLKIPARIDPTQDADQACDERRPPGLVAGDLGLVSRCEDDDYRGSTPSVSSSLGWKDRGHCCALDTVLARTRGAAPGRAKRSLDHDG